MAADKANACGSTSVTVLPAPGAEASVTVPPDCVAKP